jgi:hypothetical protein
LAHFQPIWKYLATAVKTSDSSFANGSQETSFF